MSSHLLSRVRQLYDLNRFKQCYEEASKLLQTDTENEDAYFYMLASLIYLDKLKEAEKKGKQALSVLPTSSEILYLMGWLQNEKINHEKAIKYLKSAIEIDPTQAKYFVELSKSYFENWEKAKVIKYLNHALSLDPNNSEAYQLKSFIERKFSKVYKAHFSANQALELSPEDSDSHIAKALAFWKNNSFKNAEFHLATATKLDPTDYEALSLWLESKVRSSKPFGRVINLLAGNNYDLSKPTLILGFSFFAANLHIRYGYKTDFIFWIIFGGLMIPQIVFWFIRPWIKFKFLGKKFKWELFKLANNALAIDFLCGVGIISSFIYWISKYATFYEFSIVAVIFSVLNSKLLTDVDSSYPIFKRPYLATGMFFFISLTITLGIYFLW